MKADDYGAGREMVKEMIDRDEPLEEIAARLRTLPLKDDARAAAWLFAFCAERHRGQPPVHRVPAG